jgi:hypothetical protein
MKPKETSICLWFISIVWGWFLFLVVEYLAYGIYYIENIILMSLSW